MNAVVFTLADEALHAMGSGALWWPAARLLAVADLHLGKSERIARRQGNMLPPYKSLDTLARLGADIAATDPATVVSLGDSFDDDASAMAMDPAARARLSVLAAGRRWIWVSGNHDPAGGGAPGHARNEVTIGPLVFRHIAHPGATAELSGHYHPKASIGLRGCQITRRCFLHDAARAILPAYGTYTGGLPWTHAAFAPLLGAGARAILTGPVPHAVPMPLVRRAA